MGRKAKTAQIQGVGSEMRVIYPDARLAPHKRKIRTRLAKGRKRAASGSLPKRWSLVDRLYDQNRSEVQESSHSSSKRDAEELLRIRKSEILRGTLQTSRKDHFRGIRHTLHGICEGKQAVLVAR